MRPRLRDRTIQLDLARNRLIDATVVTPRQRTTQRVAREQNAGDGEELAFETLGRTANAGIEGWRGWRLADVGGLPHLQSISAGDIWDGPCFTSDERPAAARTRAATGIHAYATPGQMQSILRVPALVYGQVTLHGQVCVHETGFRAERARVDRLFLRACGRHAPGIASPTGVFLLDVQNYELGSYCACESAPIQAIDAEPLGDREDDLPMRYGREQRRVEPLRPEGEPLRVAAGTEVSTRTREQVVEMILLQPKQRRRLGASGLVDAARRRHRVCHARSATVERPAYARRAR